MRKLFPYLLIVAMFLVAVPIAATVDNASAADEKVEKVNMEAAKETFENMCSKCHATSRALSRQKDRAGWEGTVNRMSKYHERFGGPISEEDVKGIVEYLVENAGK